MNIHESAEDYLEKILMLQEQKGSVRSIDIAVAMGYSKPSVSVAMKNLRENGYISMDNDGFIKLEAPGMEIANRIYGRHQKRRACFVCFYCFSRQISWMISRSTKCTFLPSISW